MPAISKEVPQVSARANTDLMFPPTEDNNFCDVASSCCMPGMDSYGWIAATVGWALWFFTLILLCVCKVMDLRPNETKYVQV